MTLTIPYHVPGEAGVKRLGPSSCSLALAGREWKSSHALVADGFKHKAPARQSHKGHCGHLSQELPQKYLKSQGTLDLVGGVDPALIMFPDQVADVFLIEILLQTGVIA